jgi:hypothetical protein
MYDPSQADKECGKQGPKPAFWLDGSVEACYIEEHA